MTLDLMMVNLSFKQLSLLDVGNDEDEAAAAFALGNYSQRMSLKTEF